MSAITASRAGMPAIPPRVLAARAFANEAGKGLRLMWQRRAVTITALIASGFFYLMIQFFIGGGHLVLPVLALTLPALFAETIAATAALGGSGGIAEEINGGTMEQTQLSPASPSALVLGKLAALAVEGLVPAIALALAFGLGGGYRPAVRYAGLGIPAEQADLDSPQAPDQHQAPFGPGQAC